MRLPLLLPFTLALVACSDGREPSRTPAADPSAVESARLDGVWTFFNQPDGWDSARFTGTARVVDGCLRADDHVLVWMKSDERSVTEFIASLGTSSADVVLGGGGRSLSDERSTSFGEGLAELMSLCPTSNIWFSAPLEDGWVQE